MSLPFLGTRTCHVSWAPEVWTRTCHVFSHFRAVVCASTFAWHTLSLPVAFLLSSRMQQPKGHHLQEAFPQQQAELGGSRPIALSVSLHHSAWPVFLLPLQPSTPILHEFLEDSSWSLSIFVSPVHSTVWHQGCVQKFLISST